MNRASPAPPYTEQQRDAITRREVSVALSAGAGCGKTFVLTERFLSCFETDSPDTLRADQLSQLVAITFTERAAREMRDRIRRKCHERLLAASPDTASHWAELLRSLDKARISTIHAFCASLLRRRAVEAGIDPQFGVLEQPQSDTLLSEAIDDELRRLVAEHDRAAIDLAVRFDLRQLAEMISTLARETPQEQFAAWSEVSAAEQVARWQAFYRQTVVPALARGLVAAPATKTVLAILEQHVPSHPAMLARRADLLERLPALGQQADADRLRAALETIRESAKVQGGGGAKAWPMPEIYETYKQAASDLRGLIDEVQGPLGFDAARALEVAELSRPLLAIAAGVRARYDGRKAELNVLDFGDLLTRTRRLLVHDEHADLRRQLSSQIRLLLIDEFQDTDPDQVELVEALCGSELTAGKLFFVGDHKQSIYRFRGAKPHVFRELRERTPQSGRLSLTANFRSQPAILDFINALFQHDLGDDYEPLHPWRPQVSPRPAVEFLWAPADATQRENKEALRRREAIWIARRLRGLLDSREAIVWDVAAAQQGTARARAAKPGDIALLFRAMSNVAVYEDALRQYGIDYYVVGGWAFYAQQEIYDLLNLLRSLDTPCDQISLVGALRSGFFSLADETIFWLSRHAEGLRGGLMAESYPAEIPSAEQSKARFAAVTLEELASRKDRLRVCELIELALERTAYDASLLSEFLGERKLANLRKLIDQARGYQQGDFLGLSDFIRQLSEFVVRQPDEPLAATHSEDTNVVRLMSVHQAKGLEFPIVVVPDIDRTGNPVGQAVRFDSELGPLVRIRETAAGEPCVSGYDLWRIAERAEEAAEIKRLLYVATTRAADYLILSSSVDRVGSAHSPWARLLAERFDLVNGTFRGELPAEAARPEVRVTLSEPPLAAGGPVGGRRVPWDALLAAGRAALAAPPQVFSNIDPLPPDRRGPRQYSFSRLAGTLKQHVEGSDSAEGDAITKAEARGLGTLVHAVLAAGNHQAAVDYESLVRLHAERHLPVGSAEVETAVEMLRRFAASPRARQVSQASEIHVEVEFLLAWPPARPSRQTRISGFLDLLYRDGEGGWHILDFKTNQLGRQSLGQVAALYEMQMLLYALAAEQILGVAPSSLTLHFLRTGGEHAFAWNQRARSRVIELVDQGVAAAEAAT